MNKTKKISGWLVVAAALLVMTMMTMTACSSEGDDILGGNGPEQPKEASGVRVTVSAGISDGEGTTRSAVTKDDKGRRTLKFTEGDRLHIYAVLEYDKQEFAWNSRPLRMMTGMLNMQGAPTGDDLQASFSGELTVYKWDEDGSEYIVDPDQTVKDGDAPAADPLAVSYEYCDKNGHDGLFYATLVHKDAGSNFTTVANKTSKIFGRSSYKSGIAPDVETLMTSMLPVSAYNYDTDSHGINLNETGCAIFNCAVSGLPSDGDYVVEITAVTPWGDIPKTIGTVTVTGGAAAFAFDYFADDGEFAYKIKLKKGTDTYTIDLGTRELATKVYNVTRYWTGSEFYNPTVPLTMEALTAGTIVVNNPREGMQFSLNGGEKTAVTSDAITVAVGDKVQFYGDGTTISSYYASLSDYTTIAGGTAEVKVYGNIMSLVDEDGYASNTTLPKGYTFRNFFKDNTTLTDASGLILPAPTLTTYCYAGMFYSCSSLTAAPELPAETVALNCYQNMFNGCSSLTTAPELPAETVTTNCYAQMFNGCSSLTTAPVLPATTLAQNCYAGMFKGCTSLTAAPELPAKTLAEGCYQNMFDGCSKLSSVTCLATNRRATNCTNRWLKGVSASGTFTKAASMTGWPNGIDGIPSGWTVNDAE